MCSVQCAVCSVQCAVNSEFRPPNSPLSFGCHFLGLFFGLFDGTDVHERVFWKVIPFSVAQLFEAADGVGQRGELTRFAGEDFRHVERLRQESLDAASAVNDGLIFFAQFVDAQDRDDVLQFAVTLERRLNFSSDRVMVLADVSRIKNT